MKSAVRRLMHDQREIARDPLPHAAAHPLEEDLFEWHCTLQVADDGPYKGVPFHLALELPQD